MARLRMRHENDSTVAGLGLAGLTAGFLAGLAAGAYLAHRLGGSSGISEALRRRLRKAGKEALARSAGPMAEDGDHKSSVVADNDAEDDVDDDVEDEDELSASEEVLDEGAGDDWQDDDEEEADGLEDEGDLYGDEEDGDEFSSADPELEDRVLEAFTNDPILSERAVDIGAVQPATIELIGTVYSHDEYDYASTLTGGVPGVEKVVNRLVVREPEGGSETADRTRPGDTGRSEGAPPTGKPRVEDPSDEETPRH